jgi:SNF2 family DNA or RNA helicase
MFSLHAGFRARRLLVWLESHPVFDAGRQALEQILLDAGIPSVRRAVETTAIWLPSVGKTPVPSNPLIGEIPGNRVIRIARSMVNTVALETSAALDFLSYCTNKEMLGPGILVGPDLVWWTAAMRFAGALVARQQFLPGLARENGGYHARWRPAYVGRDDDRRNALVAVMPPAARACAPELPAARLFDEFLDSIVDGLVRSGTLKPVRSEVLHDQWLAALSTSDGKLIGEEADLRQLERQLNDWRRPISVAANAPFRLCFRLEEPGMDAPESWRVRYLLQARNDPSLLVPADVIWHANGAKSPVWKYPGFQPREHMLFSLGQASGICPRIEESLRTPSPDGYAINATGAHDFLTAKAIGLEEAGFGVMLPAWWTRKGTKARLTAGATVKSPFHKGGGLSLDALLDFQWQVSIGGEKITLAELRALVALKAPLVKFRGHWVHVNAEEIQAALDFWKKKGTGQMTAREAVRMALGAAKLPGPIEFGGVTADGWLADLIHQLEGRTPFEEIAPPEGLHATLRPYQVRGYSWLAFVKRWGLGACLADDMGLGKTIQTLSLIQKERRSGTDRPVLLVCPTSVVGNWQKEAARFTPELAVMAHHGLGRARGKSFAQQALQQAIVISSYALLHRDFEHFKEVSWAGVVLDEAQNIKNPETKQAAAARGLDAGYRIALTGTPVENNVGDLWSILEFLNPGLLGTRAEFKRNFFLPIQSGADPEATTRLKRITGPFILRRLKTDKSIISDLPPKMEMKVFCTLSKEQASLYSAVVKQSLDTIESSDGIQRKGIVLATLARLKQVCNHPAHFLGDNSPLPGRSGKLARLTEMLEEAIAEGDRVLVFTQFAEMGEMLRRHLQETFGREALFLHGGVPRKKRDDMVARFQEEPDGPQVFILSLKAGGTGLNLTRASHVFHFDRWWNPAVENQATDRAFRIGQKKNVQVHKFVCAGTLEERIDEMIEHKKTIAAGVVGTGEGWLTELSTAQLKDLFTLRD